MFVLQNQQCLEGWNSAFEEDMPWKPALEHMQSDHVATRELRYFLTREIGECFQLIDNLTFLLFDTSLNHRWTEEGR